MGYVLASWSGTMRFAGVFHAHQIQYQVPGARYDISQIATVREARQALLFIVVFNQRLCIVDDQRCATLLLSKHKGMPICVVLVLALTSHMPPKHSWPTERHNKINDLQPMYSTGSTRTPSSQAPPQRL